MPRKPPQRRTYHDCLQPSRGRSPSRPRSLTGVRAQRRWPAPLPRHSQARHYLPPPTVPAPWSARACAMPEQHAQSLHEHSTPASLVPGITHRVRGKHGLSGMSVHPSALRSCPSPSRPRRCTPDAKWLYATGWRSRRARAWLTAASLAHLNAHLSRDLSHRRPLCPRCPPGPQPLRPVQMADAPATPPTSW